MDKKDKIAKCEDFVPYDSFRKYPILLLPNSMQLEENDTIKASFLMGKYIEYLTSLKRIVQEYLDDY